MRVSKPLKTALRTIGTGSEFFGEHTRSFEDIIWWLWSTYFMNPIEIAVTTTYKEKSLTTKMESQTINVKTRYYEEIEDGIRSTGVLWNDDEDNIVTPMIWKEFEITIEDNVDSAKEKAIEAVNAILEKETKLLMVASETDKLYIDLPLEVVMWLKKGGGVDGQIRVSLNTSATPTFEDAVEATK